MIFSTEWLAECLLRFLRLSSAQRGILKSGGLIGLLLESRLVEKRRNRVFRCLNFLLCPSFSQYHNVSVT